MKKKTILVLTIIMILIIGCLGLFIYRLFTKERVAITFEQFRTYVEEKGYHFQNNEDHIPVDTIGKSCAANIREHVKVEFTECVSDEVAQELFNNYIILAGRYKENGSVETTVNLSAYGKYTMEISSAYMQITRIGNTIMHVRVPKEAKQEVCDFMDDLGYLK